MKHNIDDVKSLSKLKFDDDIIGGNINASYTHWEESHPMFLIGIIKDNVINYDGTYIKGLENLRKYMINNK